ncbi:MAG TPA: hypothetical protein VFG87_20695 [Amycolatopsis sp.]|nr:hypothetical protein [Amycolatopsis sp.]
MSTAVGGAVGLGIGLGTGLGTAALLPRKLAPLGVPARTAFSIAARGHLGAGRYFADALTRTWGPVAIPVLAATKRGRLVLALALARHLVDWARGAPGVGLLPWLAARTADDLSYGAGVWRGCLRERTVGPLIPDLANWPSRHPPPPSTEPLRGAELSARHPPPPSNEPLRGADLPSRRPPESPFRQQ